MIADVAAGTLPPNNIAVSTQALPLPVDGEWVKAVFPVGPGFLTAARGNVPASCGLSITLRPLFRLPPL
jgi:hypothetical protein